MPSAARRAATTIIASGSTRTIRTIILIASDQGAIVTVNGGESWSSWLNQPTAAFYHVAADNAFPYRLCSGQQESGSACVRQPRRRRTHHSIGTGTRRASRSTATPRPIRSIPNIVYGGKVTRYDRRTGRDPAGRPARGGARGGGRLPLAAHGAARLLHRRSARAVLRRERRVEDDRTAARAGRRSAPISRAPTRSFRRASAIYSNSRDGARAARWRGVHDRAVVRRHQAHLGRHRRRPDSDDGRRRRALDRRHAARSCARVRGARSRSWMPAASTPRRRTRP